MFLVKWVCTQTFFLFFMSKINFLLISGITITLLPFTFRWFIWFFLSKIKLRYSWIKKFFLKFLIFLLTILTLFIIINWRKIYAILTWFVILLSKWLTLLKIETQFFLFIRNFFSFNISLFIELNCTFLSILVRILFRVKINSIYLFWWHLWWQLIFISIFIEWHLFIYF